MYFPKLSKISLMIINEGSKFQVCFHPSEIIDGCCARKKKKQFYSRICSLGGYLCISTHILAMLTELPGIKINQKNLGGNSIHEYLEKLEGRNEDWT